MQTAFDPILWFDGFTERTRKRVVRHLLNTFEERDPQFLESTLRWARDEPVTARALIPINEGFRTISVYLSVETGDLRLLRILESQLGENGTKFDRGLTVLKGGILRESWLFSLGVGTFSLFGCKDILELLLAFQRGVQVPAGLRSGQLFPGQLPPKEGMVCQLFHGQILIIASFEGMSAEETASVSSGAIDVGLLKVTSGLALLAVRVPGLIDGWADLPIALGIEDAENALITPPDKHGRIGLVMILIDRTSGNVSLDVPSHKG
jgi:hypothetical protein